MKHRITFDTYCPVVSSRRAYDSALNFAVAVGVALLVIAVAAIVQVAS
jgi:hypothetical protein